MPWNRPGPAGMWLLRELVRTNDPLTVGDLATRSKRVRRDVAASLSRLLKRGLVRRYRAADMPRMGVAIGGSMPYVYRHTAEGAQVASAPG